jgi:hypothetical protein
MKKALLTLAIVSLVISLVAEAYPANAVNKPSTPEFTLKYVDNSYDVPPTFEIDPYTGKNTIKTDGFYVENKSVTLAINNPPFSSGILFYNVSTKGHYESESNWRYVYLIDGDGGVGYLEASAHGYTVFVFGSTNNNGSDHYSLRIDGIKAGAKIDFAVQAYYGYYSTVKNPYYNYPFVNHSEYITVLNVTQTGDWSPTQTLIIPESSQPSPSPTIPEFPSSLAFSILIATLLPGLIIYRKRIRIAKFS